MYRKNRHSCFYLRYHLVLITKYRCPVIKGSLSKNLKKYIYNYFNNNKVNISKYKSNPDYIYIYFEGKPNLNLANFINGLKTNSSKFIRDKHLKELSSFYSKPYFWSNSYFVGNNHENSLAVINSYLKNQKE